MKKAGGRRIPFRPWGIPDVTLTLNGPGGCTDTTMTNGDGTYRFRRLATGTYTVTPTKEGCTFIPRSQEVTISRPIALANFTGTCQQ